MTSTPDTTSPIKVMQVITSPDIGGAETVPAGLVTGDAAESISHGVVSLKQGGGLGACMEARGIPVRNLGIESKSNALRRLACLVAANNALPTMIRAYRALYSEFVAYGRTRAGEGGLPPGSVDTATRAGD